MAKKFEMTKVENNDTGTKIKKGIVGTFLNVVDFLFELYLPSGVDVLFFFEGKKSVQCGHYGTASGAYSCELCSYFD